MLLSLLASVALAGEVEVIVATPVAVMVDGTLLEFPEDSMKVTATDLDDGTHIVEIRNMMGRSVAREEVALDANQRVRMEYRRKQLTVLSTSEMAPAPAPKKPAVASDTVTTPAEDASTRPADSVSIGISVNGSTMEVSASSTGAAVEASGMGSLQIEGAGAMGKVWLEGREVPYVKDGGGHVGAGIPAGTYELRVEKDRRVKFEGPVEIKADQNHRCVLNYSNFDCHYTTPALGSSIELRTSFDRVVDQPTRAAPKPAPVPEPVGPVAMDAAAFARLESAVANETFSDDKLDVVKGAAGGNHFTCDQVGRIVDQFTHSSDKVDAVKVMRPKVVDPENAYTLSSHFTFSSDKEEVQALFQ